MTKSIKEIKEILATPNDIPEGFEISNHGDIPLGKPFQRIKMPVRIWDNPKNHMKFIKNGRK